MSPIKVCVSLRCCLSVLFIRPLHLIFAMLCMPAVEIQFRSSSVATASCRHLGAKDQDSETENHEDPRPDREMTNLYG
jgi:hypothetical protein